MPAVRFQVLTAADMKMAAFWVVAQCILIEFLPTVHRPHEGSKHIWNVGELIPERTGQ
jgi:hypothetical protein